MAVAQNPPPVADRPRRHVALGQEVAPEAVGDLAGIDAIVLLFGRRDGPQHQRVRHFYGCGMRQQMVIDPPAEHRCFHRDGARLRKRSHPSVQLAPARADFAFLMHTTSRVLHAIADRLLVYVQPDVVHVVSEEPPRLFSESASPLSSASCNTSCSSSTQHSNNSALMLSMGDAPCLQPWRWAGLGI